MARKSRSASEDSGLAYGCGCFTVLFILAMIFMAFIIALGGIRKLWIYISAGIASGLTVLLISASLWAILRVVIYRVNCRPLSFEEIEKISKINKKTYSDENYSFKKGRVLLKPNAEMYLSMTGRWYEIEEPLDTFPSYIATLLEGKHHEWIVIAIEKDGLVCNMWVNKGKDNTEVTMGIDLDAVVNLCTRVGGYTIMRFHNHPNPNPRKYTTLLASEQDKLSANYCAQYVCNKGYNWLDFVCARGEWLMFYAKYSDILDIRGASASDLIDKIGITPRMDYQIRKEYIGDIGYTGGKVLTRKRWAVLSILICVAISYCSGKDKIQQASIPDAIKEMDDTMYINPSQEYVLTLLDDISGVQEMEVCTEEGDEEDLLGEECSAIIYFSYDKVNQSEFKEDEVTPVQKGVDAGGCIEVCYTKEKAESRMTELKLFEMLCGSSYRKGSVIVRTSSKLSVKKQNALQKSILEQMAENPPRQ